MVNLITFFVFAVLLSINQNFLDYIAIKPSNILKGDYLWTFFTSMFMHGGVFHIFANMFSLIFVGSLVEKILGPKRYLGFYLISGLLAGLLFVFLSLIFVADYNTYAVGASGALFGLVGLLVLLTPNLSVYLMFVPIPIKMKYAGPGILILLWIISGVANIGIGNTAHLGGLLAGLSYGIYLKKKFPRKTKYIMNHFR
ncbi:MAG: rhomboid family intramembrane serine protease [Candidatus Pacearchaeota archaeon]